MQESFIIDLEDLLGMVLLIEVNWLIGLQLCGQFEDYVVAALAAYP